jgi:large subunit ribosomal protein L7Ae
MSRIKVPGIINQFTKTLDRNQSTTYRHSALTLVKLLKKYSPEDDKTKEARLKATAASKEKGQTTETKKPSVLKFGLNHVTKLVEEKKAKLVVIASNVDPIELVLWLPQLCRKSDVPYCFVKSKAMLGDLVHQKTATAVAIVDVRKEVINYQIQDSSELESLSKIYRTNFNDDTDTRRHIGGNKLGFKSQMKVDRLKAQKEKESIKKAKR